MGKVPWTGEGTLSEGFTPFCNTPYSWGPLRVEEVKKVERRKKRSGGAAGRQELNQRDTVRGRRLLEGGKADVALIKSGDLGHMKVSGDLSQGLVVE